ncbi:hypothetical protein Q0Z83_038010 [Actinoplanes sichuanensis]|uniref:CdiI immunity protein domain-containing protein n=1 Tax=Actinoplanes sichuanensis TaxID=512349 RepID=A0ABW4A441_9ACTN|nr:hypothetical protein [Actinoplanes sichuanensis]BEL05610.1 hypothetical protein Q0Z83_038010 [Actinoplanes sichuanensis]
MTESVDRDLNPPTALSPEPPWELWLGFDLEQFYEIFGELYFVAFALPPETVEELGTVRRWTVHQLRQLRVPTMLIEAADYAAGDLTTWTRPQTMVDPSLNRRRRSIRDTFELLIQITGSHVRPERRRYYDLGVMFYRLRMCVDVERMRDAWPDWVHHGWPGIVEVYQRELARSARVLIDAVAADDADPALHELDDAFRTLTTYLETDVPPDDELRSRIATAAQAAGLLPRLP